MEIKFKSCKKFNKFTQPFGNNRFRLLLKGIKQRCTNPNNSIYKNYGGRGISCFITLSEIYELWQRDKAHLMKYPSLDRKDNNGHYTFENCRFIETSENSRKAYKERNNDRTVLNCHIINFQI